jgi:hypothetical protein
MTVGDAWFDAVSGLEEKMAWYLRPDYPIPYCESETLVKAIEKMLRLTRMMVTACDDWGRGDEVLIQHFADLEIPGEILAAPDDWRARMWEANSQE